MRTTRFQCRFLKGPHVSTRRMWSCRRDPGTWNWGGHSFVWNSSNMLCHAWWTCLWATSFPPTSRPMAAFHKLLKTRALSFFVCVAANHLFWILHIWKSIQNRKWWLWGILTVPWANWIYNLKHVHIMQEWWPGSVAMLFFNTWKVHFSVFRELCFDFCFP